MSYVHTSVHRSIRRWEVWSSEYKYTTGKGRFCTYSVFESIDKYICILFRAVCANGEAH